MKNFYTTLFLLVSLVMFVVSAKAEYVSEQLTFNKIAGGQSADVELDFSSYDLSTASSFTFEFPLGLTSYLRFINEDYGGEYVINAGTYLDTLTYKLSVVANKGNGSSVSLTKDDTSVSEVELTYTVAETVNLSEGNRYTISATESTLPSKLTLTAEEFLNLLDEDDHLNMSFNFRGQKFDPQFPPIPGINSGTQVESLVGEIKVSFDAAPVTPEPSSLLIFGAVMILGLPFAWRFRRKSAT
ncbi:MAG: PEP-CTERM sorting domain-containing protein [Planctomycetaceae bacterium]|nr:PEP-CTERM sorting domain-containing protein [Planctomycetaceae bacterium]